MSGGRAASAITSRRAKEELIRLLFSHKASSAKNKALAPGNRVHLDGSSKHSYQDLRTAYLRRVHELHPDKAPDSLQAKGMFVELQSAWINYAQISKPYRQSSSVGSDDAEGDFTMFGVGCSFSDNEQEKQLRSEIMDQASRGWFSSGSLADANHSNENLMTSTSSHGSTLFTQMEEEQPMHSFAEYEDDREHGRRNKSLVSDQIPPWRRRNS